MSLEVPEFDCDDVDDLRAHVERFIACAGIELYGFAGLAKSLEEGGGKRLHILSNTEPQWQQTLEEVVARDLPHNSVRHASLHLPPVGWSGSGHIAGHTILDDFALDQIRRVRDWGLNAGLLVPVFAPELEWGFMAFYSRREFDYAELTRLLPFCSLYSSNFAFWYLQLTVRSGVEARSLLTGRESDCLKYAAKGLTSHEIAKLLGISHRTVESYIAAACAKLKARGRRQAIMIASDMKLIGGKDSVRAEFERQRDEFGSRPLPRKVDRP